MAETSRRDASGRPTRHPVRRLRPDRVYLGWQFALPYPDPGLPPRRPTPPAQTQLNPAWIDAQRQEESQLNRPLKLVVAAALGVAGLLLAATAAGSVNPLLAAVPLAVCLVVSGAAGYALWQGKRVLERRVDAERHRVQAIRTAQERELFAAQEEHARRYQAWQDRKVAYDRQLQWYAVAMPDTVGRVDVAGGTMAGWSALVTTIGTSRISAGGELTVLDLCDGAVAGDLVGLARRAGRQPQVWVLPEDLASLDVGAGLGRKALADVLSLVVSVGEEPRSARDTSPDAAILERVLDALDDPVDVRRVAAALRALTREGDPHGDMRRGLLTRGEVRRLVAVFGRGAADRDPLQRAGALESRLRKLEPLGSRPASLPASQLRVVSAAGHGGLIGSPVLATYVATALTHLRRAAPTGKPWRHTVVVCGADRLRGDVVDRLVGACESSRTGLLLCYRSIPPCWRTRSGQGGAAVAFMRLENADDAQVASEHIGADHRLALSRLTETVGTPGAGPGGDSYTSTVGGDPERGSASVLRFSDASDERRGNGRAEDATPGDSTWSPSRDTEWPSTLEDSENFTEVVANHTAWVRHASQAAGGEPLAGGLGRYREMPVERRELQRLPVTAAVVTYGSGRERQVALADANPAILSLPRSTVEGLEDARRLAEDRPVAHASDPGGTWGGALPPNLGPPPQRLDWR